MANESGGTPTENKELRDAWQNLTATAKNEQTRKTIAGGAKSVWEGITGTVKTAENRQATADAAKGALAGTMNFVTGLIKPKTPEQIAEEEKKKLAEKKIQDEAAAKEKEKEDKKKRDDQIAAAGGAADTTKPEEKPAEMGWMAKAAFKLIPGASDFAAASSVSLSAKGKEITAKYGTPKVNKKSDDMMDYYSCMTDEKNIVIPKSIYDYSRNILAMMGLEENEERTLNLATGFIGWVRERVSEMGGGMLGIKAFNGVSSTPGSILDMFNFGDKNPKTLLSLFSVADPATKVDARLLTAVKKLFTEQGVPNIEKYLTGTDMDYRTFLQGYAQIGHDMVASGKWKIDATVPNEVRGAASDLLSKKGITDVDGSLADGIALACVRAAEGLKKEMQAPAPQLAVKPEPTVSRDLTNG